MPNPAPAAAQVDRIKEAVAYYKGLSNDSRLDPLRGVIAIDQAPTLEMQSNPAHITDAQRPALEVLKSVAEQCRSKMTASNARLAQIIEQITPHPAEHLTMLYKAEITIGEYLTDPLISGGGEQGSPDKLDLEDCRLEEGEGSPAPR